MAVRSSLYAMCILPPCYLLVSLSPWSNLCAVLGCKLSYKLRHNQNYDCCHGNIFCLTVQCAAIYGRGMQLWPMKIRKILRLETVRACMCVGVLSHCSPTVDLQCTALLLFTLHVPAPTCRLCISSTACNGLPRSDFLNFIGHNCRTEDQYN